MPFQLASAPASSSAPPLPPTSLFSRHPHWLPADQLSELMLVLRRIGEDRGVSCDFDVKTFINIKQFGTKTFLRVEYGDWKAQCAQLSDDWDTSWHGALTPFILNIVLKNGFFPAKIVGAGGNAGLFHSNNFGLLYPFKYAYPSPLLGSHYGSAEKEYSMSGVPIDVPLFHSLMEIRVRPMRWCKRGGRKIGWHVTPNERIPHEVCLSAALFCIYHGPRTDRAIGSAGHILMPNGVPFDGR